MISSNILDSLIDQLVERGYGTASDVLPAPLIETLHKEQDAAFSHGQARPATVGRGVRRTGDIAVRGDQILWWDPAGLSPAQRQFWQAIDDLRLQLNRTCFLNLDECECHYARYEPGHGYARHRDSFLDDNRRIVSFILYLNPSWRAEDGGALRLYLTDSNGETASDILPDGGTLVLLKSREIEHAVLLTRRRRDSITGWLRTHS